VTCCSSWPIWSAGPVPPRAGRRPGGPGEVGSGGLEPDELELGGREVDGLVLVLVLVLGWGLGVPGRRGLESGVLDRVGVESAWWAAVWWAAA